MSKKAERADAISKVNADHAVARQPVEDAAEAHVVALARAKEIGFDTFIVSALTPIAIPAPSAGQLDANAIRRLNRPFGSSNEPPRSST